MLATAAASLLVARAFANIASTHQHRFYSSIRWSPPLERLVRALRSSSCRCRRLPSCLPRRARRSQRSRLRVVCCRVAPPRRLRPRCSPHPGRAARPCSPLLLASPYLQIYPQKISLQIGSICNLFADQSNLQINLQNINLQQSADQSAEESICRLICRRSICYLILICRRSICIYLQIRSICRLIYKTSICSNLQINLQEN